VLDVLLPGLSGLDQQDEVSSADRLSVPPGARPRAWIALFGGVESQERQAGGIEEHALAGAHETKDYVLASRAPGDDARPIHVDMSFGKAPCRSAVRTSSLGRGDVDRKNLAQFACGSVAVKMSET
jgi:hypothetical protein